MTGHEQASHEQASRELLALLTLRRVARGGLLRLPSGRILDRGRPTAGYVSDTTERLLADGLLVLETADPDYPDQQRVALTTAGQSMFEALRDGRDRADDG